MGEWGTRSPLGQLRAQPRSFSASLRHLRSRSPHPQSESHSFDPTTLSAPYGLGLWAQSGLSHAGLRSLALTGTVHPSAIIHIARDHLHQLEQQRLSLSSEEGGASAAGHVLVLTPSQAGLHQALLNEGDSSILNPDALDTSLYESFSKIEFVEAPTSAHLTYFLATLYTNDHHSAAAHSAWTTEVPTAVHNRSSAESADPSYLPTGPTLVVLHNPSGYLAESELESASANSYGQLVALFIATFSRLPHPPFLVVHDRLAIDNALPLLPTEQLPPKRLRLTEHPQGGRTAEADDKVPLVQVLRALVDRVGVADRVAHSTSQKSAKDEKVFRLVLDPVADQLPESVIEWVVAKDDEDDQLAGEQSMWSIKLLDTTT